MLPEVQTLIDAGLRPSHVARLLDVNRATVGDWYKGGTPHRWIADKVQRLARAVSIAVDAGKLPVNGADASARTQLIAHRYYLHYLGEGETGT